MRIRSDLTDVKSKFQSLLDEADMTRQILETADKKLADMYHKQQNKLEISYKSMIKALEAKKKEFHNVLKEFYNDQR